jgi:hypothetical protein
MGILLQLVRAFGVSLLYLAIERDQKALLVAGATLAVVIVVTVYNNATAKFVAPKSSPVPPGKVRICVSGYTHSAPTAKAHYLANAVAKSNPSKFETWYYFDQYTYWKFVRKFDDVPFPPELKGHCTSPFCWLERSGTNGNVIEPIGGADRLSDWVLKNKDITDPKARSIAMESPSPLWYLTGKSFHHERYPATAQ